MGKIVRLKNKKTGVRVYPVTATAAVVDANSGERLNDTLQNKVEEAPMDDNQYARINGAWAKVEGGGDETALITLLPNSSDLYGATVKVTTEGGETLLDTTWQGAALSVVIPAKTVYTVTVGEKDGFIAPSAVTHTAVGGGVRSIAMTYTASTLTVNILSNQGTSDSDISDVKATVSYSGTSVQVGNGEKISLPLNTAVTITFPAVANYKAPSTISFTHTGGAIEKSGTYQTEVVKVSLSTNNGVSVVGQIVTINNIQHTWNGSVIEQKVAFGASYKVLVNDKPGYINPINPIFAPSYTAGQPIREISIVYTEDLYGVFIEATDGTKYRAAYWDGTKTPNGVAIVTSEHSFVVALNDLSSNMAINDESLYEVPSGITAYSNEGEAKLDYNGATNTDNIVNTYRSSSWAAGACANFIFPNGKKGYLGAAGEMNLLKENIDAVLEALSVAGGAEITEGSVNYYWTSTMQQGTGEDIIMFWACTPNYMVNNFTYQQINSKFRVRAFTTL